MPNKPSVRVTIEESFDLPDSIWDNLWATAQLIKRTLEEQVTYIKIDSSDQVVHSNIQTCVTFQVKIKPETGEETVYIDLTPDFCRWRTSEQADKSFVEFRVPGISRQAQNLLFHADCRNNVVLVSLFEWLNALNTKYERGARSLDSLQRQLQQALAATQTR